MSFYVIAPLLLSVASAGTALYIVVRKVFVLGNIPKEDIALHETFFAFSARKLKEYFRIARAALDARKHYFRILVFLEKLLRRVKVLLQKTENRVNVLSQALHSAQRKTCYSCAEQEDAEAIDAAGGDELLQEDIPPPRKVQNIIADKDR